MNRSDTAALVQCRTYDWDAVEAAVRRAVELLGGMQQFVRPGMRVAIKANLLKKQAPEACVTTHPSVIAAVAKLARECGGDVVIGDSPGGPFTLGALRAIYEQSGMVEAAARAGARLNEDLGTVDAAFLPGEVLKQLTVCKFLHEADVILNCAKLKTHGMTTYTGAVKNLFGAVPGTTKVEYHFRMPQLPQFAGMLVDLNEYLKPQLNLIDAIVGMEGEGPGSGDPREVGCLIAAHTPYAADLIGIRLMNLEPMRVATVHNAHARGLCPADWDELTVLGDPKEAFVVRDFAVPSAPVDMAFPRVAPAWVMRAVQKLLRPKPVFDHRACIGCGDCARSCPPKAIAMHEHRPRVDLQACIRCFCCQELCPKKAVHIKRSRILKRLG